MTREQAWPLLCEWTAGEGPASALILGAEALDLALIDHVTHVIQFMRVEAAPLGLRGAP